MDIQQAIQMLQSYQTEIDRLQQFVSGVGKAPQPTAAVSVPQPEVATGDETLQLTAEKQKILDMIIANYIRDRKDEGQELVSALTKLGRYAQSEFDKLRAK